MRLLYVIDSLAPGGAETSLAEMAPGLIARGIELHVLPLGDRLDLAPTLEEAGATVHHRTGHPGRIANIREVIRVGRMMRPDLIHTTLFEADIAGRTAARILGVPSSTSLVNDSYGPSHYAESNALKLQAARILDAVTSRFATRFHAITTAIADSVPPRLGISPAIVEVIPRGRDAERFPYHSDALRAQTRAALRIAPAVPVILAVGRLEPQKGLQHLLRALPAVSAKHPDVLTLIAGKDGRAAQSLRSIAADLNLNVQFLGHRTDVAALMSAADVFCFPSEREGFGGVLIEAMAVGCPIVASAIPTSIEVLTTNNTSCGLLVNPNDPEGISDSIDRLLTEPQLSRRLSERGLHHFEAEYTLNLVVDKMVRYFHSIVLPTQRPT